MVPDGPSLGVEILKVRKDHCPVCVDAIGVGTSVVDWLEGHNIPVMAISGNEKGVGRDSSGKFKYKNKRAQIHWEFRESLDPKNNSRVCLPPDGQLLADLCAARYKVLEGNIIQVESKPDLRKRLGRSPDRGDGVIYASAEDQTMLTYNSMSSGVNVKKHKVKRASSWG